MLATLWSHLVGDIDHTTSPSMLILLAFASTLLVGYTVVHFYGLWQSWRDILNLSTGPVDDTGIRFWWGPKGSGLDVVTLPGFTSKLEDYERVEWGKYLEEHRQKLLLRADSQGFCLACASIATSGGLSHHRFEDMKRSAAAGCLLCGLFITTSTANNESNGNVQIEKDRLYLKMAGEIAFDIIKLPDCQSQGKSKIAIQASINQQINWITYIKLAVRWLVEGPSRIILSQRHTSPERSYRNYANDILGQKVYWSPRWKLEFLRYSMAEKDEIDKPETQISRTSSALFESSHRLVSPRPENAECIDLARAWLDTCRSSHYRCASSSYTSCPKRLLQVRGNLVYLREGNYDKPLPLFVTLSYCWGVGKKLETTAETIEAHKRGIPITLLPRTIGEAVKVATWLGIQYIWVDALCIVQDSKDDWETECAKMGSYYNNSVLTISALESSSANDGFLFPRSLSLISPLRPNAMDGLWVRKRQRSRNDIFENAALNKRGWALQERLLSTRVLHYGKAEMYWECLTCAAHESSNNIHQSVEGSSSFLRSEGEDFKRCLFTCGPNSYSIIDGAYALWYRLVSQYSRRQLTKSSDMLPAIEGLAAKIATLTGSQYVSGIFTNDLSGLCWTQQKLQERVSINMVYDLATGWSWASVGGPVIYPFVDQEYVASPFDAEFVRYEHSDECITFDCKVKTITSIHGYNEHAFVYDEHGWQGKWISCQLRRSQMFDAASLKLLAISICHRQWKPPFQPAYGHDKPLRIGKEIVYHGPRQCDCEGPVLEDAVYFLIVAPAEKPSTYRRLGVGVSNSAADCSNPKTTTPFSPSSRRRITLVQSPIHSTGFIEK